MFENTKWYQLAKEQYDEKTFEHALRVMNYAKNHPLLEWWDEDDVNTVCQVALLHDLIEDTDFKDYDRLKKYDVHPFVIDALRVITKLDEESYNDYCRRIHDSQNRFAYIVKLADMKDHLSLKETLGKKRKEKYLSGLAELL